jgi:anti-sigma regulatory factor (Ser/Thr protein kinase)
MDSGRPFDPARLPATLPQYQSWKDLPEGGYGLPLIRAVMHDLHYERRASSRNHWRLGRLLPAPVAQP